MTPITGGCVERTMPEAFCRRERTGARGRSSEQNRRAAAAMLREMAFHGNFAAQRYQLAAKFGTCLQ